MLPSVTINHVSDSFHFKGEALEVALEALNNFGRIINCGFISTYNTAEPYSIKVSCLLFYSCLYDIAAHSFLYRPRG